MLIVLIRWVLRLRRYDYIRANIDRNSAFLKGSGLVSAKFSCVWWLQCHSSLQVGANSAPSNPLYLDLRGHFTAGVSEGREGKGEGRKRPLK